MQYNLGVIEIKILCVFINIPTILNGNLFLWNKNNCINLQFHSYESHLSSYLTIGEIAF